MGFRKARAVGREWSWGFDHGGGSERRGTPAEDREEDGSEEEKGEGDLVRLLFLMVVSTLYIRQWIMEAL